MFDLIIEHPMPVIVLIGAMLFVWLYNPKSRMR